MRCSYGLAALPGTDPRFFSPETSFLRLPRTVHPTRIKFGPFKIRAKIDEARKGVSFYELLGIPEKGTLLEIKQAYKQLARKYHPDVSPPDRIEEYTERFIRVQEAYETLSDPRRRALYDKDLAFGLHLAFSARRRYQYDEDLEDRSEWRNQWQSQLSELKKRSMNNDAGGTMSWGARMRRQREEMSKEL
ncbi:Chaperone protein dnaJ 20 [Hibiscus syriacus]|uniref:Chaperone protein dnaJ 20 n=1 Tax=Hibiscus syriacus TaxID=106335 RepID=A0A6A3C8E1_HIBSY|nr:chaperone protein dnaJ 20, chloroplastic-like [Hibiscus syriacus]KAE8723828.1 Chaperone protein dnaJ 20 [Hibiscus syriacus]